MNSPIFLSSVMLAGVAIDRYIIGHHKLAWVVVSMSVGLLVIDFFLEKGTSSYQP